jgi:hypothetical protein
MDLEIGGDLLDRHPVLPITGGQDRIVTELSGKRHGAKQTCSRPVTDISPI